MENNDEQIIENMLTIFAYWASKGFPKHMFYDTIRSDIDLALSAVHEPPSTTKCDYWGKVTHDLVEVHDGCLCITFEYLMKKLPRCFFIDHASFIVQ